MPYSEDDFARMAGDPEFARQYFWKCAMSARRRALKSKAKPSKTQDEVRQMEIDASFSKVILENMDRLVQSVTD